MELLKQPLTKPLSLHEQVITLVTARHKIFVDVEVRRIKEYQMNMLAWFDSTHPEIGQEINEKKVLSEELEARILDAAKEFKDR